MIFRIQRTSEPGSRRNPEYVEINTLEELIALQLRVDEPIILDARTGTVQHSPVFTETREPYIEVYDDYRE